MTDNKPTLTISYKQAELISHYYDFPTAVFLLSEKEIERQMKGKRRKDWIFKKIQQLEALKNEIKKVIKDV